MTNGSTEVITLPNERGIYMLVCSGDYSVATNGVFIINFMNGQKSVKALTNSNLTCVANENSLTLTYNYTSGDFELIKLFELARE